VGISRATLHRLFNSRSALEIAVAEFSIANLEQATQGVISTGATGKIAVDRLMEVALPIAPSLGFLALKSSATIDPIHQTTTDAIYQVWESWCVEGQRRGEIRLDVPSRWAVRAIPLVSWGIFAAVRRGEVAATDARHLLRTTIFEGVLGQAPPKSVTLHLPTKETSSKDTDPARPAICHFPTSRTPMARERPSSYDDMARLAVILVGVTRTTISGSTAFLRPYCSARSAPI
jgi:hypothetical protein